MTRYLVTWKANASVWPTDPKQALAVMEMAAAGGNQLFASGSITEMGWFNPQEGMGIFESDSKEAVLAMTQGFFPYYSQDIREIVPFESGTRAMVESARQNAAR